MNERFEYTGPVDPFYVHGIGVHLAEKVPCEHGHPVAVLYLAGHLRSTPGALDRFDTVIPRCILIEALGSLHAAISRTEGTDALQAFQDDVAAHTAAAAAHWDRLQLQHRDCCEAGFRTHGREHTCRRTQS